MLVVGDKEVQSGMVAVRGRSSTNHGNMPIEQFLELIRTDTNHTLRGTATHSKRGDYRPKLRVNRKSGFGKFGGHRS